MKLDNKTELFLSGKRLYKSERNFIAAWFWVKQYYPNLYKLPQKIVASTSGGTKGSYNFKDNSILLNTKEDPFYKTPVIYVRTFIHELTHAHQYLVQHIRQHLPYKTKEEYEKSPIEVEARKAGEKAWNEWQRTPLKWEDLTIEQLKSIKI
jgi:hypothetical protein